MTEINDFGFTFDNEPDEAIRSMEQKNNEAQEEILKLNNDVTELRRLNREMFAKITTLCNNLKENPEKPVINWPNRVDHINKFLTEIEKLRVARDSKHEPDRPTNQS